MKLDVPSNYVAIGRMLPQVEVHRRVKPTADGTLPVMLYGGSLLRRELFFDRDGELQTSFQFTCLSMASLALST